MQKGRIEKAKSKKAKKEATRARAAIASKSRYVKGTHQEGEKGGYFPEQLLSISQVFSVLQSLKAEDFALTFCLREVAKHQGRLVKVVYKDKTRNEQVEKLKEQNKEYADTKTSLDAARKEATEFELVAIRLKQELFNKEPLFMVGVTVGVGFIKAVKRTSVNSDLKISRENQEKDVISAKNDAVHRANIIADRSLFTLGILKITREKEDFEYVYKVSNRGEPGGRFLAIKNLWGSMVACYFKTTYTHDKVALVPGQLSPARHALERRPAPRRLH
ncbi:uncharacterized protein PAC_11975 [Phialocephala subalpina]|uniref:Uncharacterized protein n=1 Tax=Phialocephala subalpina TaxID=576137 RepID=A0A1L7XAL4_9HELO|nr:uncharacterized protein PAC_11975 [Phialocephala subalpina]